MTDPPERLRLEPDTGPAGTEVQATATGYECRGDVVFLAEGDEVARAATREEGTATQTLTVPEDTAAGRYALVAQCETDASQSDAAQFTVTSTAPTTNGNGQQTDGPVPPGPNPPGPVEPSGSAWDPTSWWPAAVLLALLLAVSLQALRLRRGRRWPQMHVRAVPGAAATAGVQTNQTPTDPSSPDVVVRIEPHADPGTQTINEVDP